MNFFKNTAGFLVVYFIFVLLPSPVAAATIDKIVTVQPIQVCDDNGANCANPDRELFIDETNKIFAQAGIIVEFLPWRTFNSTTYQNGLTTNGSANSLANLASGLVSSAVSGRHANSKYINMWFVKTVNPGNLLGYAHINQNGVYISDRVSTSNYVGNIAHEIGHNLGEDHNAISGNLMNSSAFSGNISTITPDGPNGTLNATQISGMRSSFAALPYTPPADEETPDVTAPSVPTNFAASVASSSQINLSWTASTDPTVDGAETSGVAGYRIYRAGTQIATSTGTSYSNTGLSASTQYSYTIASYDVAGNASSQSSAIYATTSVQLDTTSPTISFSTPSANATVSGTITLTASASDNVGVVGVQFRRNGTSIGSEITSAPYTTTLDTTALSNGSYTLTATARDAAGNTRAASVSVTVTNIVADVTAPVISSIGTSSLGTSSITVSWSTNEDARGYVEYGLSSTYTASTSLSALLQSHSHSISGLSDGTTYHYRIVSTDDSGNTSRSSDRTFTTQSADSDNDGVANGVDLCPGTPADLISLVNAYGCAKPRIDNFDIIPNLNTDIRSLTNLEVGKSNIGKIQFREEVSLTRDGAALDLDSYLRIEQKKVTLNPLQLPELDKPATVTLYNITETNPKIMKDGVECTECVINSYRNGVLTFTIPGF